jgi:hypothetical protein
MCCLKYEQDAYEDLIRTSPKAESFVDTPEGRGTVTEIDLLRQRVKVRMENHPEEIHVFSNTEIAVLRNGKAKKNDPPIPADLAPISGSGKQVKKEVPQEEESMFLDPIRFRYSTEAVVEEPPVEITAEQPEPQEKEESRSSRRRKRHSKAPAQEAAPAKEAAEPKVEKKQEKKPSKPAPKAPKEKQESAPKAPKEAAPKAPKEGAEAAPKAEGEAKKPHRRRPNYRRKPSKPKQNPEG